MLVRRLRRVASDDSLVNDDKMRSISGSDLKSFSLFHTDSDATVSTTVTSLERTKSDVWVIRLLRLRLPPRLTCLFAYLCIPACSTFGAYVWRILLKSCWVIGRSRRAWARRKGSARHPQSLPHTLKGCNLLLTLLALWYSGADSGKD